jgi:hypothetical protein
MAVNGPEREKAVKGRPPGVGPEINRIEGVG